MYPDYGVSDVPGSFSRARAPIRTTRLRLATKSGAPSPLSYLRFLGLPFAFCESALPEAVFPALLTRSSRSVEDALDAALDDVVFSGAFVCESALPAPDFDFFDSES